MFDLRNGHLYLSVVIFLVIAVDCGLCLECYACTRQDGNKDKCVKTTKQCEEHQDICISTIEWGLPRYWVPYGDRVHYVSKECSITSVCEQIKEETNRKCKRDWFNDWTCVECCSGDLCNYYVTLDGIKTSSYSIPLVTLSAIITLLWIR